MLTLIDEYTRESLAIGVGRRLTSRDVIDTLAEAMVARGMQTSSSMASSSTRQGGAGTDRALAGALQHAPVTLVARLPSAGARRSGKPKARFVGKCGS
jgi:hypothetical protein